jgi:hypothetical protein
MKVGFMVMIQKQSNNRCSGKDHNHPEQKRHSRSGVQQRACSFFLCEGVCSPWICSSWQYGQLWLLLWRFEMLERKCAMKKIRTLAQPRLAPSWQRTCPHVPENHRVCDLQQHGYHSPSSLLTRVGPCDFALFPKLKIKLKGRPFETAPDIWSESQRVLNSIKENDFHGAFEMWRKLWDLSFLL